MCSYLTAILILSVSNVFNLTIGKTRTVVVTQLTDQLPLKPGVLISNPVISNFNREFIFTLNRKEIVQK